MAQPPRSIAIIGAGLAGLSLTLLLSRITIPTASRSLHITILESRPRNAADGGYLALAPNALHVLDQLGLYEKLLPQGYAYEDLEFVSARNLGYIGLVNNGGYKQYGYPALRISRGAVRGCLLDAVERLSKRTKKEGGVQVEMRFEAKVAAVEEVEKEGKVNVKLAGGEMLAFDAVIGADGIHSKVRSVVDPNVKEPEYSGMVGIGGGKLNIKDVMASGPNVHLPVMVLGRSNAFAMMPTVADGSEVSCFATLELPERDRKGWASLGADNEELKRIMVERHCASAGEQTEWPTLVTDAVQNGKADSLTLWPQYNGPALSSWTSSSSRIIIMGDAAHAMPPTGGQGAAMAFEDAASLAMVFQRSLNSDAASFDEGVAAWQSTRRERCTKIKAFTTKSGDMRRESPSVFQQIIKEWVMWAFFWVKGKEAGLAWVYEWKEECPGSKRLH